MENEDRSLTIGIHMANEECERLAGVQVTETADGVEIQAFGQRMPGDGVCGMNLDVRQYTVTLEMPLGDRLLTGCMTETRPPLPADCADISS
jgi:hypothetical protein